MAKSIKNRQNSKISLRPIDSPAASTPAFSKWVFSLTVVAILIAAIPFFCGKYREFAIAGPFDSSLYVYSAQKVLTSHAIYKDFSANARPATMLINTIGVAIFGYSELGPKIIQTLMQLAALAVMFYALRRIYGHAPAVLAIFLAAFFLSCPPFAKYGNVKEQYMIACMIVGAAGLMLYHSGKSWLWLFFGSAVAANTYFFKPTGVSVILAMLAYIMLQPVLRHRSIKQFAADLAGVVLGALAGLLPLTIFFACYGQTADFLKTVPILNSLVGYFSHSQVNGIQSLISGGAYLEDTKKAYDFAAQFDTVMTYYRAFIIPIGLAVLAIGWRLLDLLRKPFAKPLRQNTIAGSSADHDPHAETPSAATKSVADYFLIFLVMWWVLDMLFVWISPRSYVEYYLPLNASSAFLAAYALWKCLKNHLGFVVLILAWGLVDLILTCLVVSPTWPYLGWRSPMLPHYWGDFGWYIAPVLLVGIAWAALKNSKTAIVPLGVLGLITAATLVWRLAPNIETFRRDVHQVIQDRRDNLPQPWEQVADYINKNSTSNDGLYVWGWFPGIYVRAQRDCPAMVPAFGDMHTLSPQNLGNFIAELVGQLRQHPPKFIVDPQRMHFPYDTHPVFDLWPRQSDEYNKRQFIPADPDYVNKFSEALNAEVEKYTYKMLTRDDRRGGPLTRDRAAELANNEKLRHVAMLPLRLFVIKNYTPVVRPDAGMLVFVHK